MYHASGYLTYLADMICEIGTVELGYGRWIGTVELTSTNQLRTRAKPPRGLSYSVAWFLGLGVLDGLRDIQSWYDYLYHDPILLSHARDSHSVPNWVSASK